MAMNDAIRFLERARTDEDFRIRLYASADGREFRENIKAEGFDFSGPEIADALRGIELKAVDEYEAGEIKEIGQWYNIMADADTESACPPTGCSPSACASCSICR